jgi:hypothetical protein
MSKDEADYSGSFRLPVVLGMEIAGSRRGRLCCFGFMRGELREGREDAMISD